MTLTCDPTCYAGGLQDRMSHGHPCRLHPFRLRTPESETLHRCGSPIRVWARKRDSSAGGLAFDFNSHAASGAFDHPDCLINTACVEILHFLFGDVLALVPGHLRNLGLVGNTASLAIPAACLSRDAAGGLLVTKSKLRSL